MENDNEQHNKLVSIFWSFASSSPLDATFLDSRIVPAIVSDVGCTIETQQANRARFDIGQNGARVDLVRR